MDKVKIKALLDDGVAKGKAFARDVKDNFRASEGMTGAKKVQSMFVNLWNSGTNGKIALSAGGGIIALLLISLCCGGEKPGAAATDNQADAIDQAALATVSKVMANIEAKAAAAEARIAADEARITAERDADRKAREAKDAEEDAKTKAAIAEYKAAAAAVKDVESARKAFDLVRSTQDPSLIEQARAAVDKYEKLADEAAEAAREKEEAERIAKEKAEEEAEKKAEEARIAKIKAEKEAKKKAWEAIPAELSVKGIAPRMSGDAALEACNKLVAGEQGLVVLDYRKGLVWEKDDETKAKDKKYWDSCLRKAEADIDRFMQWHAGSDTYVPALKFCVGRQVKTLPKGTIIGCDNVFVQWNSEAAATIPGPNYQVDSAMAALAGIFGYQVEWMLVGEREGARSENKPKAKSATKPKMVVVEKLTAKEYRKLGGVKRMSKYLGELNAGNGGWQVEEFGEKLYPQVFDKGLQIHKDYRGTVFCRVLLQDSKGKSVDKTELATDVACSFPWLVKEAGTQDQQLKAAERHVDEVVKWNNGSGDLERIMDGLAEHLDVSVEWAVVAEPVRTYEQITETFTIPATDYENSCKFLRDLDSMSLGRYSGSVDGNSGARKRHFFKKGLVDVGSPVWFRLILKDKDGVDVPKEVAAQNWLSARGHSKPSDTVTLPPKNVIKIVVEKKGVSIDKLPGICYVWLDDNGNVKETYFPEEGMARLFDARGLSGEEFANLLVKSYPGLPNLTLNVETTDPGRGTVKDNIWTYQCPKGYRVKLFERTYINKDNILYDANMLEKDVEVQMALSLADLLPKKFLSIKATKPDAARKFD